MKARHLAAFLALSLVVSALLAGCGDLLNTETPVSIDTRVSSFVNSLNGDRTKTADNLVPGSATAKANNGVTTLWDTHFPTADGTYASSITSAAPYTASDVRVSITPSVTTITKLYKFVMQNEGTTADVYYISDILVYTAATDTWTSLFGTT
jgi:hypothetical protein